MGIEHSQRFCDNCDEYVLAVRKGTNHILHLLLTLVTGGIWIIVWIFASVKMGGWKCSKCGSPVYKLFTTKELNNAESNQDDKSVQSGGGNYSIAIPISFIFVGVFAFLMAIVRKEITPFFFAGGCLGIGYLLYIGRQNK